MLGVKSAMLRRIGSVLVLLLVMAGAASAQESQGGPIDVGNGDYMYWSVTFAPPFTAITLTYYGPDFPVPVIVIITGDGRGNNTFSWDTLAYQDEPMSEIGTPVPIGP